MTRMDAGAAPHSFHLQEDFMNRGLIGGIVALIVVCMIVLGSWYTVDQTERGVLLRNGAVVGTAQPGLGFKIPMIDSVEKISVKTATYTWDKMNSYSYDQQPADLKVSVTLRAAPEKVADLYAKFGRLDAAPNQGGRPGRDPRGQGRVGPLHRGQGDPGPRPAQQRDQGRDLGNAEIRSDDRHRIRAAGKHRV